MTYGWGEDEQETRNAGRWERTEIRTRRVEGKKMQRKRNMVRELSSVLPSQRLK